MLLFLLLLLFDGVVFKGGLEFDCCVFATSFSEVRLEEANITKQYT